MRLTIFQSDMGDCLLLEAASGELMLCDGGMRGSLQGFVREELGHLREAGRAIDLVYVSHIDNDHISGVLQLLEDEAEWRVHDLHAQNDDPIREPKFPRPPVINGILHNAFRDQVTANKKKIENFLVNKQIENLLIAAAPSLYASAIPELIDAADEMQGIAAGIPEALKVSRLTGSDALDIPLNKPPGVTKPKKLLFAGQPGDSFALGSMQFTLIGPTRKELLALRKGWDTWLRENQDRVKKIRAELRKRIEEFSAGSSAGSPYDLRDWNGIPDYEGVTAPNVASLMFLVEEAGKRLLLTGDAQQDFILEGLRRTAFLSGDSVHLDVLKVQHHGSEHNMDADFTRSVSADHYVFCGNGSSGNPEIAVLDLVFESRVGNASARARAPEAANRDFHFWFSTTSALQKGTARAAFEEVEEHVAALEQRAGGRLKVHYNGGASTTIDI